MVSISYNATIEDITAYGKLVYAKSPTVKEHLKKTYYFSVPMLIIIGAVLKYYESNQDLIYFWAVVGIGWLVYLPFYHKKKYLKKFIASFEDEKYQNLFGEHELTIEDDSIADKIEKGVNHTKISKIEHIEIIDNYAFVFIDSAMAYLIPENKIIEGNYNNFVDSLNKN